MVVNARFGDLEKDRLLVAFKQTQSQLEESNIALLRLAAMDGLTGIANRRLFDEVLEREWIAEIESGAPLSLVLADVDNFKLFNDIYGHLARADFLKRVAQVVGRMPERQTDLAGRYGGEEFALILPCRTEPEAARIADAIRRGIQALSLTHNGVVTVSVGVVTRIPTGLIARRSDRIGGYLPLPGQRSRSKRGRQRGRDPAAAPHRRPRAVPGSRVRALVPSNSHFGLLAHCGMTHGPQPRGIPRH